MITEGSILGPVLFITFLCDIFFMISAVDIASSVAASTLMVYEKASVN